MKRNGNVISSGRREKTAPEEVPESEQQVALLFMFPAVMQASVCFQDLDPRWYAGMVTRGQAEACLKQVHKVRRRKLQFLLF